MNEFKVIFKRLEVFYQTIIVTAANAEEARTKLMLYHWKEPLNMTILKNQISWINIFVL